MTRERCRGPLNLASWWEMAESECIVKPASLSPLACLLDWTTGAQRSCIRQDSTEDLWCNSRWRRRCSTARQADVRWLQAGGRDPSGFVGALSAP